MVDLAFTVREAFSRRTGVVYNVCSARTREVVAGEYHTLLDAAHAHRDLEAALASLSRPCTPRHPSPSPRHRR